ncbi:MAG: AhpC/TSA family protein [Bacteroidaceae bacterium]|nr:AhpC/TSA family protein [Bacteroidaceae bacterium]
MNRLFGVISCFCMCVFCACVNKPDGYVIRGTAEGTVDGDTVFLCNMEGFFSFVPFDTAIVKDGKFEFTGFAEEVSVCFVLPTHDGSNEGLGLIDIPFENSLIEVQLFKPESQKPPVYVDHGPDGPLWEEYKKLEADCDAKENAPWQIVLNQQGTPDEIAKAQQELDSITAQSLEAKRQFIVDHAGTGIADYLFSQYYMNPSYEATKDLLLKEYAAKNPDGPHFGKIMKQIEATKNADEEGMFTDFTMNDNNGKPVSVMSIITENQYTLVDFWASWCGPCRAEMPNVVAAYQKYHDKGFEVVGVSLDEDKKSWIAAIEKLQMPWPQLSDLKGWQCEGAVLYKVQAIPSNLLVDQSGKIVAKNLREDELQNKLAELFK